MTNAWIGIDDGLMDSGPNILQAPLTLHPVAELLKTVDFARTSLGPPDCWDPSLKSVIALMVDSQFPMFVAWGDELAFLYNDAYAQILGGKHPAAFGARFKDIWHEIWDDIFPLIDRAMRGILEPRRL
jgi:hypothetical protein